MNEIAQHPAVRDYLRDLDQALAKLHAARARELREQIGAHIDDALIGADDQEVAAVIARLGAPADLVAEAAGGSARAGWAGVAGRTWRFLLARFGRRKVGIGAAIAALACSAIGYGIAFATAAPLQVNGGAFGWLSAQDNRRDVTTNADGSSQETVPVRSGQRQGFFVTVYNPTGWTQTIEGFTADFAGSLPNLKVAVSTFNPDHGALGADSLSNYRVHGSIPPHQHRLVVVFWTSDVCLVGGSFGFDTLPLRVRIGWFTRAERVNMGFEVALAGPSQGRWAPNAPNCR